jgi:hypothetical protein
MSVCLPLWLSYYPCFAIADLIVSLYKIAVNDVHPISGYLFFYTYTFVWVFYLSPELDLSALCQYHGRMRGSSTQQAADKIGISKRQLLRWIYDGKIPEVRREHIGGLDVRVWTADDIRKARQFKQRSSVTRMNRTEN